MDAKYDWRYDTDADVAAALSAITRIVHLMCSIKPDQKDPKYKDWDREMTQVRRWAVETHYRQIRLLQRKLTSNRVTRDNVSP